MSLISLEELREIRRIWQLERQDWQDSLPQIYESVTGQRVDWEQNDAAMPGQLEAELLAGLTAEADVPCVWCKSCWTLNGSIRVCSAAPKSMIKLKRFSAKIGAPGRKLRRKWRSGDVSKKAWWHDHSFHYPAKFRHLRRAHTFDLTPRSDGRFQQPIILLRGQNGAGKSTLMEAIRLGLHGKLSLGARSTQKEYEQYLERRIYRAPDGHTAPFAAIQLEFDHVFSGSTPPISR
jgi:hypothetical protein